MSGAGGSALHLCDPEAHGENLTAFEEALRARNTMHNRVVADAFIPAGGRPATIHEGNWEAYLRPDNGQPSSKLIVEGANLFLTAGARKAMHAATGIPIVKDSSANKCGVICSSYEIISSMLLSHDEFAAVKPELVSAIWWPVNSPLGFTFFFSFSIFIHVSKSPIFVYTLLQSTRAIISHVEWPMQQ